MENTEKQEEVIQEVKTEQTPVTTSNEEQPKQETSKIKARIIEEGGDFKIKLKNKISKIKYIGKNFLL